MKANICLALVSACLSGCLAARPSADSSFLHLAGRNLCESSSLCVEDQVFKHTAKKFALAAYRQVCRLAPDGALSAHYQDGFVEGYIDYLDAGGTGEPPAMGPFRYRLHEYQTFEGRRALHEWFAGFRHGASVAKASGFRELILMPVASFPCEPPPVQFYLPPSGQLRDGRQQQLYSVPPTQPVGRLPAPRVVPAEPPPPPPPDPNKDGPQPTSRGLPAPGPPAKARLLLPEPLPIALQQGGVR
jgi:hypothetical protein